MIARVWHGVTSPEHADAYENQLKPELLPGISAVPGYCGSYLLRRVTGEAVEFVTILLFESLDHIRAVAGEEYERAVVPDVRRKHLLRWDEKATHYEVAATHGLRGLPVGLA